MLLAFLDEALGIHELEKPAPVVPVLVRAGREVDAEAVNEVPNRVVEEEDAGDEADRLLLVADLHALQVGGLAQRVLANLLLDDAHHCCTTLAKGVDERVHRAVEDARLDIALELFVAKAGEVPTAYLLQRGARGRHVGAGSLEVLHLQRLLELVGVQHLVRDRLAALKLLGDGEYEVGHALAQRVIERAFERELYLVLEQVLLCLLPKARRGRSAKRCGLRR